MARKFDRRFQRVVGQTVDFPGYGRVVVTGWSRGEQRWPLGRFAHDPSYFGSLVFQDERARDAALAAGAAK